ncbi:MAG: 50S ribosomal protein L3 [Candidatus Omnitrophica bacterium]|nr:50S ribosomal protein L3 [Candidatus Omnitrophota bacterium]
MIREIYGKKLGMTQSFDAEGNLCPVTLLEVKTVYLLRKMNYPTKNKVQVACFKLSDKKSLKIKKPLSGYFKKLGIPAYKLLREVTVEPGADLGFLSSEDKTQGVRQLGVDIFKEGDTVDVRSKTKGKGFAGGMKRYGWRGGPRTHGSTSHRRIGSAGSSAYPSRIIKGLHMPGHMGNKFRTTKNLTVKKVDKDRNLIFISGCVPGPKGTVVCLKKVN